MENVRSFWADEIIYAGEYFHLTSSKVLFYSFDNDLFTQEIDTMNIPL